MRFDRSLRAGCAAVDRPKASGAIMLAALALASLQGCASSIEPKAEGGDLAYKLMPAAGQDPNAPVDYVVGPSDVLTISVFQEKDLSLDEVPVDASGGIIFPLIGQLQVAGRSTAEVAKMIAGRLGDRFLVNPQVSVLVKTSVSQKVTVDGEVRESGVYAVQGTTSLTQAVAMAKGVSEVAKLDQVVVFRTVGTTRYAARFDLGAIQAGYAADPQIRGGDVVIVGLSGHRVFVKNLIAIAPTLSTAFVAVSQLARN